MLYFIKLAIDTLKELLGTPIFMGYGINISGRNVVAFCAVVICIKKIWDAISGE